MNMKRLDLKNIALIGRTFVEYERMFNLREHELKQEKILDVASGVSSFSAEAKARGFSAWGSDQIYELDWFDIERKCKEDLAMVLEKLPDVNDMYRWDFYKDIFDLKRYREEAYKKFVADFKIRGNSVYFPTFYPKTNFLDKEFTLALVSHFLFLYDDLLDYDFHRRTLLELIRVTSKEIRIFPVVNLGGKRSDFVEQLIKDESFRNVKFSIHKVAFEFLKNANEYLLLKI